MKQPYGERDGELTESTDNIDELLESIDIDAEDLDRDDIFHLLQCRRRRLAIAYILENEGRLEMRTIAEQIAAMENETTVRNLKSQQRQRVYIALYQSHLPKLDKLGIIDYNQSRGWVEATPMVTQFDRYLTEERRAFSGSSPERPEAGGSDPTVETASHSPDVGYVYVGVVSALILGAYSMGLPPVSILSSVTLALVIMLLFSSWTTMRYFDVV